MNESVGVYSSKFKNATPCTVFLPVRPGGCIDAVFLLESNTGYMYISFVMNSNWVNSQCNAAIHYFVSVKIIFLGVWARGNLVFPRDQLKYVE